MYTHNIDDDPRKQTTKYIVEGDSFDVWQVWNEEVNWIQGGGGYALTIGWLDNRPVVISVFWNKINRHDVLFWDPTSQVVDYLQIEEWMHKTFPHLWFKDRPGAHCDNKNFHLCIHALEKLQ